MRKIDVQAHAEVKWYPGRQWPGAQMSCTLDFALPKQIPTYLWLYITFPDLLTVVESKYISKADLFQITFN